MRYEQFYWPPPRRRNYFSSMAQGLVVAIACVCVLVGTVGLLWVAQAVYETQQAGQLTLK